MYSYKETIRFRQVDSISFDKKALSQKIINEFDKNVAKKLTLKKLVDVVIEDVPFAQENEVYIFKGFIDDKTSGEKKSKVFKLAKFKEVNLEDNFWTRTLTSYMADIFCNKNLIILNFLPKKNSFLIIICTYS